ncbi:hypothetical protein PYR66_13025 [Klebsiella aerogenes]|nr:hypothetical protein PYR66_13025 [Klebsiella aerogenes]
MNEQELLIELLRMHEANESLTSDFAIENYEGLKNLFDKGLSNYRVTKMMAGNVRARKERTGGILTPVGLEKAKAIS